MDKSSNKRLYIFLLLSFLFILQTFLYETDTYSPCNDTCFQDTSYIDLVCQPDPPVILQINSNPFLNDYYNDFSAHTLQQILIEELNRLRLRDNWGNDLSSIERHIDSPSSHIISILKKKNNCHQSSDDLPLPHIYS
jgi:hypothetical protein